jgi:hypothetical protein
VRNDADAIEFYICVFGGVVVKHPRTLFTLTSAKTFAHAEPRCGADAH